MPSSRGLRSDPPQGIVGYIRIGTVAIAAAQAPWTRTLVYNDYDCCVRLSQLILRLDYSPNLHRVTRFADRGQVGEGMVGERPVTCLKTAESVRCRMR